MKFNFLAALMLLCACSFAQKPDLTDNLNPDKQNILEKHVACYQGKMLWANYHKDPNDFIAEVDAFKKEAYSNIETGNAKKAALKKQDIDYFARGILSSYEGMYGADSTAYADFKKISAEKRKDPNFMSLVMAQLDKMKPKIPLTKEQKGQLDSLINTNTNLNDETLFKQSATYRLLIEGSFKTIWEQTKYKNYDKSYSSFQRTAGTMPISLIEKEIENPFIVEYECYKQTSVNISLLKKPDDIDRVYQDFKSVAKNSYYLSDIQSQYDNYKSNMFRLDFTYTAIDGKPLTLSSLRGKYVYIDVWATWCGPCKAEIPHLMEIEDEYKGKNIVFVSISVDKQADSVQWRKFVTENGLTGYQVMADKELNSDFVRKIDIIGIPHFILIDPTGNIVASNAKRPSDPALKEQFDKLLH